MTTTKKIIPLKPVAGPDDGEDVHTRFESAGFMRMTQMSEPRLSELVAKYKAKGFEVEVAPYYEGDELPSEGGGGGGGSSCGSASSCSSATSASGCASGSCGSSAPAPAAKPVRLTPRKVVPSVGTIYVRLP